MNVETFSIFKRALLSNEYDLNTLKQIKTHVEPLFAKEIDLLTEGKKEVRFNYKHFLTIKDCPEYKDELVITFLLFIGKEVGVQKLIHMVLKPFGNNIYNWMIMYKVLIYTVLSLIYNKKFTNNDMLELDQTVLLLSDGHVGALRQFMKKLNILNEDVVYDAETHFIDFRKLDNEMFGPFIWRMIHFMAEAVSMRKNAFEDETKLWIEFTEFLLHRTLPCYFCAEHYKEVKKKHDIGDVKNYSEIWYKLHNDVNLKLKNQIYPQMDFERDRKLMQKLLS